MIAPLRASDERSLVHGRLDCATTWMAVFVHELHGLDDAHGLTDGNRLANIDKRLGPRSGCPVNRTDHRRLDLFLV